MEFQAIFCEKDGYFLPALNFKRLTLSCPANCNDARKASSIRGCQLWPLARRVASTSASNRSFTGSLGEADFNVDY